MHAHMGIAGLIFIGVHVVVTVAFFYFMYNISKSLKRIADKK